MPPNNLTVEEILVQHNYVSQQDVDAAKKNAPQGKIIEYLLSEKKVSKDLLGQAIAEHNKLGYFDLDSANIPQENFTLLAPNLAQKLRVVITGKEDKTVTAATDSPGNADQIRSVISELFPQKKLTLSFALKDDMDELFKVYKDTLQVRIDAIMKGGDVNFAELLFTEMIKEAIDQKASDIHFEPVSDKVVLRYRVDGVLKVLAEIPNDFYENVLNRIKVLANIRLDEHFRPQDGAIRYQVGEAQVDLRVSAVPLLDGQKVVLRLLGDYIRDLNLDRLGFSQQNMQLVETSSHKTYGMILTTGPTGSGKTTTLYALIKTLHRPGVNITTIEDPVEYRITGVNQIQVNKEQEIGFANGLRSIIRQDPNIILVGEIRDQETAEIAINAALTGHLLLSTFHANDAATAIPRLLDMGIEPFLLASTLNLIVAQRLVRKICETCRYSTVYKDAEIKKLVPNRAEYKELKGTGVTLYRGKGCQNCNYTGLIGRTGIFELIYVTSEIQELILRSASSQEIWLVAQKQGALSFFENGLEKVLLGVTSLEELVRVAPTHFIGEDLYGKKKA